MTRSPTGDALRRGLGRRVHGRGPRPEGQRLRLPELHRWPGTLGWTTNRLLIPAASVELLFSFVVLFVAPIAVVAGPREPAARRLGGGAAVGTAGPRRRCLGQAGPRAASGSQPSGIRPSPLHADHALSARPGSPGGESGGGSRRRVRRCSRPARGRAGEPPVPTRALRSALTRSLPRWPWSRRCWPAGARPVAPRGRPRRPGRCH